MNSLPLQLGPCILLANCHYPTKASGQYAASWAQAENFIPLKAGRYVVSLRTPEEQQTETNEYRMNTSPFRLHAHVEPVPEFVKKGRFSLSPPHPILSLSSFLSIPFLISLHNFLLFINTTFN